MTARRSPEQDDPEAQLGLSLRRRARGRCEACRARDGAWGWWDREGGWHELGGSARRMVDGMHPPFSVSIVADAWGACTPEARTLEVTEILLQVAYRDGDRRNRHPRNAVLVCQRCVWEGELPAAPARRRRRRVVAAMPAPTLFGSHAHG